MQRFETDLCEVLMALEVEVLPGARRALRRAVRLPCDVKCELWDEPVLHIATELSPFGVWLNSDFVLDVGTRVELVFLANFVRGTEGIECSGYVKRVEMRRRRSEGRYAGMGIEFDELTAQQQDQIASMLCGLPPPLPHSAKAEISKHVWVDGFAAVG